MVMDNTHSECSEASKKIKPGDHISSIYRSDDEKYSVLIPFLKDGLQSKMKCVYAVDSDSVEEALLGLKRRGLDLDEYLKTGQMQIFSKHESYLAHGSFDPEAMLGMIDALGKKAVDEGFAGVRGVGDMAWALSMPDLKRLIDYEAALNNVLSAGKVALLCQYDENKFDHELLNEVIRTHQYIALYGRCYENKYFYTSAQYMDGAGKLPEGSYQTIVDLITGG